MSPPPIVVYGATGLVGGRVCAALDAADVPFIAAGRRRTALEKLHQDGVSPWALWRQGPAADDRGAPVVDEMSPAVTSA